MKNQKKKQDEVKQQQQHHHHQQQQLQMPKTLPPKQEVIEGLIPQLAPTSGQHLPPRPPPEGKRPRHRVIKRYCRNVCQDNSLMSLVFHYEMQNGGFPTESRRISNTGSSSKNALPVENSTKNKSHKKRDRFRRQKSSKNATSTSKSSGKSNSPSVQNQQPSGRKSQGQRQRNKRGQPNTREKESC